jgi:hypothetical protein
MHEIATDPLSWFIASGITAGWMGFLIFKFSAGEFRRHGYDPIDYDALQAELDEEFAPVRVRAK